MEAVMILAALVIAVTVVVVLTAEGARLGICPVPLLAVASATGFGLFWVIDPRTGGRS
jgi:hypothetical protein